MQIEPQWWLMVAFNAGALVTGFVWLTRWALPALHEKIEHQQKRHDAEVRQVRSEQAAQRRVLDRYGEEGSPVMRERLASTQRELERTSALLDTVLGEMARAGIPIQFHRHHQ